MHVIDFFNKRISCGETVQEFKYEGDEDQITIEMEVDAELRTIKYWINEQPVDMPTEPVIFNWIDDSEYSFVAVLNTVETSVRLGWQESPRPSVLRSLNTNWNKTRHDLRLSCKYSGPVNLGIVGPIDSGKSSIINSWITGLQPEHIDRVCEPVLAHKLSGCVGLQTLVQQPGIVNSPGAVTLTHKRYKLRRSKITCSDLWGTSLAPMEVKKEYLKDPVAFQAAVARAEAAIQTVVTQKEQENRDNGGDYQQLPFYTKNQIQSFVEGVYLSGAPLNVGSGDPYYRDDKPLKSERIHCLVIVIPYAQALGYVPQVRRILEYTKGVLNRRIVVLTKIDINDSNSAQTIPDNSKDHLPSFLDPVERSISAPGLDRIVNLFARGCMMSVRDVLAVQLYNGQRTRHPIIDTLALDALKAAVIHAMDLNEKSEGTSRSLYKYKVPLPPPVPFADKERTVDWAKIENGDKKVLRSMLDFLVPLGFSDAVVRGAFVSANGNGSEACQFLLQNS